MESVDETRTVDAVLVVEVVEYFNGAFLIIDFREEGVDDGLKG